jgi:hypothetical protein
MSIQCVCNAVESAVCETVVLAQADRDYWTVEIKNRFILPASDVNRCRAMIISIDDYAKIANSQYGRHRNSIPYSQSLGLFYGFASRWLLNPHLKIEMWGTRLKGDKES